MLSNCLPLRRAAKSTYGAAHETAGLLLADRWRCCTAPELGLCGHPIHFNRGSGPSTWHACGKDLRDHLVLNTLFYRQRAHPHS